MKSIRTELHLVGETMFDWDRAKAASNLTKHGISFSEAASVFVDDHALIFKDERHSETEERLILLGTSFKTRLVTVVHAERGLSIRIISAWPATSQERKIYEEER